MELRNTVAVVTGAGGGIGRELVRILHERGSRVAAVDLDPDRLAATAEFVDGGDDVATFQVDITDRDAVAALPGRVADALGPPDVVINNAGIIQPFVRFNDLDFDTIDRILAVNLGGTINMVKAFLPGLLERPAAHLVNVASMGSYVPFPGQTAYGVAKAGVKLLTEGLYAECLDTDLAVTCVMPGAINTDITGNSGIDRPGGPDAAEAAQASRMPIQEPSDAAETIVEGMLEDRLHVYVGLDARVLNLVTRVAPRQATHLITSQMGHYLDDPA